MHEYDTVLKGILMRKSGIVVPELAGFAVEKWHDVELPEVRNRRVDLLGESAAGQLLHIELQSTNAPDMAMRMLEYGVSIRRKFGRSPAQFVLYVGLPKTRMANRVDAENLQFGFRIVDIRDLDGDGLLGSPDLDDNVLSVLTRFHDRRETVREVVARIGTRDDSERRLAVKELMILGNLRNIGPMIEEEIKTMPILDDIMDHAVIGPAIRKGIAIGEKQGEERGEQRGEKKLFVKLAANRFGPLPEWALAKIHAWNEAELDRAGRGSSMQRISTSCSISS